MSDMIDDVTLFDQSLLSEENAPSAPPTQNPRYSSPRVSPVPATNTAAQIESGIHPNPNTEGGPTSASIRTPVRKPRKKREAQVKLPDSPYDMTDAWHARQFVDRFVGRLRFCPDWGVWLEYDGRRWHKDDELAVQRLAIEWVRLLRDHVEGIKRPADREDFMAAIRRAETNRSIVATIKLAQSDERIIVKPQDFDRDNDVLNCRNGTLDLKTGMLRPHDPGDNLTKLASVDYVASAKCPTWLSFLDRIMEGNQEMISFIQRALGYSLTGSQKEECMFVFYGQGQNGKSKMLDTVRKIVGDYGGISENNLLNAKMHSEHPTAIANLAGKRLVVISEPKECRFDEARVKSLTGGDTLSARKMYQDFSEFEPTHKLFVMSNHKPQVQELSKAFWRRMNLVEFLVVIPPQERDNDLPRKFTAESEGIFAWMVQGCLQWQEEGLPRPSNVLEATKQYRDEMDKIGAFLEARCTQDPGLRFEATKLWSAYLEWCDQEGLTVADRIPNQTQFGTALTQKGFESKPSNSRVWRLGLALKPLT